MIAILQNPNDEDRVQSYRRFGVESWNCIDCGFNTAPGLSTRSQLEIAFGAGASEVAQTIDDKSEVYTVRTHVWKNAGMEPWGGCLCIGCLEKRLGRRLRPADFVLGHVFNQPGFPRSERLRDRLKI